MLVTVNEYRELLNDYATPEDVVRKRVEYLEGLCRSIVKAELEKYD